MMSKDLLESIKSRLDIVDVISGYISIKRAGQNYKALCPFHSEKTPSFVINPEKQVFHCFGCGAGGDAIGFVMKYESMEFPEALRFLAEKAGLDPADFEGTYGGRAHSDERKNLKALLRAARDFYLKGLEGSPTAPGYLSGRGLSPETVKKFSLGYAPEGWHNLSGYLKAKGYPEDLMLHSGIIQKGQKGVYDMLRERVIFPINDAGGEVIAFGGRFMDKRLPKYINSSDTALFRKGETLYGLDLAKEGIRKKGYIILTEGYLDVIMCHQYGFDNAVAPLGTALTAAHLRKIGRFTNKVVLVFDGDQAGIGAARRSVGLALEQDFGVKVALLPAGEDPDSFLRARGANHFKKIIGGSFTPVEFILRAGGARVDLLREAAGLAARVPDPIAREELIRELSERGRIKEEAVRQEVGKMGRAAEWGGKEIRGPEKTTLKPAKKIRREEILLLSIFINQPGKKSDILREIGPEDVEDPLVRGLIFGKREDGTSTEQENGLLAKLSIEPGFDPPDTDRLVEDCVRKIRLRGLAERIREAGKKADPALLKALYSEKEILKGGRQHD
ncbi:MAG: DNA primase [Nitrospiraceae bacterium]|nr:DNA primase [Nitrospiraceae bacterium]